MAVPEVSVDHATVDNTLDVEDDHNLNQQEDTSESDDDDNANAGNQSRHPHVPPRRYTGLLPRPNCTHIVMDYFYTKHIPCDNCGLPPRLGWLYVCQQDHYSEAMARRQIESLKTVNVKEQVPSRIEELQACGMSRSVVDQVKQGNVYDPIQIDVLKNQKVHMLRVMDRQLSREHEPWNLPASQMMQVLNQDKELPPDPINRNVTMRSSVRVARAAATKIAQKLGHFRRRSQVIPRCGFKCCHACRPYLRDRAYISLEGAVVDEVLPEKFTLGDPPVSLLADVANLGLRPTHQPRFRTSQDSSDDDDSTATSLTCSTDSDASEYFIDADPELEAPGLLTHHNGNGDSVVNAEETDVPRPSTQRSPTHSDKLRVHDVPSSLGHHSRPSSRMNKAQDLATEAKLNEEQVQTTRSGSVLRRLSRRMTSTVNGLRSRSSASSGVGTHRRSLRHWSSHHHLDGRNAVEQEHPDSADIGLQSSNHPSESPQTGEFPRVYRQQHRGRYYASLSSTSTVHPSPRSDTSQASASSDEVAVEGGVALTEEAVETQVPDVLTQV